MTERHDHYDDNVTTETEDKLDEALALLAAGTPPETILAEAGEDEAWLRPLLEIAADVDELQQHTPIPPPGASLNKMLAHAETMKAASPPAAPPGWLAGLAALVGRTTAPLAFGFRTAALAMSLVLTFLAGTILGGSLTAAAHDSLPGQTFYGLKRTAENIRLGLTWDQARQEQLVTTYNHRRRLETELLLEQGQVATVAFDGQIQAVSGSAITLAGGLTAQITPETVIEGELAPGARIRIEAETRPPGSLQARAITVTEPAPPTPTATPTATASPTPQPTVTPTRARIEDTLVLPPTDDLPDGAFEETDGDDLPGEEDDANDNEPANIDAPEDDAANDNQNDNADEVGDDIDNEDDDLDDNANDNASDDLDNEDDDDLGNENDDLDDDSNDNTGDDDFDDIEDEDDVDDDLDEDDLDDNGDDDLDDDFDDDVEDDLDDDFDDDLDDDLDDDFDDDGSDDNDNSDDDDDGQDDEDASDSDDSSDDDEGDEEDEKDEEDDNDDD